MWGDADCSLSHTKGSDSLDLGRHSKMFRPSYRSSSPFSLTDLDMWDTKSRLTAQTSAWCGMATVSGSGFLSKVSTSTSGSTGGFRQNDPGLRRWQSLSRLAPEGATRSFTPSPGAELQAARAESSFRQAGVVQWLQDAHERIDSQLDRLRARDAQLSYNTTTAQLHMNHKLSEAMSTLEQEKEAAESNHFDKNQQRRELHEKVLKLERDLVQMRSTLDRGSNDQPTKRAPSSLSRTLPVSQEDFNRQEKQEVDTELCRLREALREAETRAKTQEEERNQALQRLQTSDETQRTLLSQIEEMNQRLSHTVSNHTEVQEQLSEANNKISQACLEKAILSTQVLKLEDNVKELKAKLTGALSDKDQLIQEKAELHQRTQVLELHLERTQPASKDQETVLMKEESMALREVNEKLTCELEMIKQKVEISQSQLQELTAEQVVNIKQIRDLEAERSELITQKEELLSKTDEDSHEMKEKCCQLRESVEVLELEKQTLQDQCRCLEAELLDNEEKLHLLEEEYRKQDAVRVQHIEELKALASHWTEKWQKVALTLQSTQEELEELKKSNSTNEGQCDSLLRVELDACKQELELERSRSQALLQRYKDEGGAAVRTKGKETVTDLSESSLLWEPTSDSHSSQKKSPQVCIQSSEVQMLKEKLTEREKELREKEDALMSLERLRETEKTEAQIKVSALELKLRKKASEVSQESEGHANVSTTDSLRTQLEESRKKAGQLQQEKMLAVQKLQTRKQLYSVKFTKETPLKMASRSGDGHNELQMPCLQVKDEKPPVEGRKDKTVCPVNLETDQQRRMVTEQLKSLFKEREGKEVGKVDNTPAAAQTRTSSPQDGTPTSKATAVDRWGWQQSSGLMPVFEEDEEGSDQETWPGEEEDEEEEGEPAGEAHIEENLHNQGHQMSAKNPENSCLKAKHESLLQGENVMTVRFKLLIQDLHTAAEKVPDKSSDVEGPILAHSLDECDLQRRTTSLYPDGIFLAQLVDICSPDEDEEEGEDK
ncbi:ERC protein 2-like isoform X3 [Seriola aureovittata]|uniref:ERC protein 2-like isoform X3 n=1 Tax=Seriola aureovittata TaxID=2871759 RepID=UPI0024BE901C|nr:ERC protein 2-like isoform X3 [Seriola aureovittata]